MKEGMNKDGEQSDKLMGLEFVNINEADLN